MSYTSFSSSVVDAPRKITASSFGPVLRLSPLTKKIAATITVTVANKGERDGTEVVLLFAAPPGAGSHGRPLQSLVAFERVPVRRGETATVHLDVQAQHFTLADSRGARFVPNGTWKLWVGAKGKDEAVDVDIH